jgi:simple sugar transport system substrate-binding protein
MKRPILYLSTLFAALALLLAACAPAATPTAAPTVAPTAPPTAAPTQAPTAAATEAPTTAPFTFGLLMVGPKDDQGWSQATFDAGQYVEQQMGAKMVYLDKVNTSDRPGTTASQLAEQLVAQGAKMVIFNSDDMKDEALKFANEHPDIYVIGQSDDWTWKDGQNYQDSPNQIDIMGRMEFGKMMAGCAAALTTQTGQIGYLGPLINDETRRLASSAYLGARYCWQNYLGKDPADLKFKVTWIGFWFNIPGVTSDPTQVADDFYNNGYDVVLSGIDTTEALTEAAKFAGQGQKVWAIPYDYADACTGQDAVCLGVPYFNWGPAYLSAAKAAADGSWQEGFQWNAPDWADINNQDTSAVGFMKGPALTGDASTNVDKFIQELAGGLNLWKGPLNLQDGSTYLADGVAATDQQIWYLPQLLQGMEGQSSSQ